MGVGPQAEQIVDFVVWNGNGARLQILANNLPARAGILLLQETTVMTECEFWEGYGDIFFTIAQEKKRMVNVGGVGGSPGRTS